ncbi:ankyrin repeat-containing domain protein [Fusarium avenaceum]|nr:ankyrin repeat-containing domain protein [Fusarium avenaceum]
MSWCYRITEFLNQQGILADKDMISIEYIVESYLRQAFHQGTLNIGENVKVQSSSMFDLHSNVGKLSGRKLNNVNLTRFVTYAEKQGLGTADEILLCIIPTLSFHDRLPNDAILACDQPENKLPESSKSKDQTCARYSYFLNWIQSEKGASLGEYITLAGVARTVEFIYLMALDLSNSEASAVSGRKPDPSSDYEDSISDEDLEWSESSDLSSENDSETDNTSSHAIDQPIKSKVSKELTTLLELLSGPFSDILERLFPFYELQGRKKTIVDFLTVCLGSCDATTWSSQVPDQDFKDQIRFTSLHRKVTAAGNGLFALENILVKNGMTRDIFGWTPFHYAAAQPSLQFSHSDQDVNGLSNTTTSILRTLKAFLKTNPPAGWWLDNFNRSPVHIAAFSGNHHLLKELLDALRSRDKELAMTTGGRDGMKPLHLAAGRRHRVCVQTLLDETRSVIDIEVDVWKQTPIHTALVNHSYHCAQQLSRSENFNFSPEVPDGFGRPLLFYLLGKGPKEKKWLGKEILLTQWDKFEAQHGDKQSVLHLAISFLNFRELRDLIGMIKRRDSKRPNIDLVNKYGETPLHLAVRYKKLDLVEGLVLFFGASPAAKNRNQLSPMMLACDIGDLSLIRTMCQGDKYSASEIDGQGRTALHHAIFNTKWPVDDCAQAVELLAGVMVDVDVLDQDHCTPLHYAVDTCNSVAFSVLRKYKANIELTDNYGRNVLHHGVFSVERSPDRSRNDLIDRISEEISTSAIDVRDKNGCTPLHLAISSENDDIVFSILSKDANPNIEDHTGMTPFMTACRYSHCHKFIKHAVGQSNIFESNINKDPPLMRDLSRKNAYRIDTEVEIAKADVNPHFKDFDINKTDSRFDQSALAWACNRENVEVVEILLLSEAVSFSIQATKFHEFTPLHLALYRGNQEVVGKLVADRRVITSLGKADDSGLTPIDFAIRKSKESCLLQLLKHHNVGPRRFSSSQLEEIIDKHRETESQVIARHEWVMRVKAGKDIPFPVHNLAKTGHCLWVEDLLQFHINAFELDEDRWTPADVAQWYGHVDLMHYLKDKESKGGFLQPPHRWPSTFFDLYKNSALRTTTCRSLDSPPRLRLDATVPKADSMDEQFCYLRTKEAIPKTSTLKLSLEIAIGFCHSQVEEDRLPGWDEGTWAYHSDDGGLYSEAAWPIVEHNEAICKQGDVMGVGLNMETGGFYRTRNGKEIEPKHAFEGQNFRIGKLYPCIAMSTTGNGDEFQVLVTLPGYQDASSSGSITVKIEVQG